MTVLLLAHLAIAAFILTAVSTRPRVAAFLGTALFATTAITVAFLSTRPRRAAETFQWIGELGLGISIELDGMATAMVLLISILGIVVLWYSVDYFSEHIAYVRFVGVFVLFAGAMSGLVMSADLFTMFVFWELTSVCSFLLIGMNDESASARSSALRALLVTGAGGLCLLAGVAVFHITAGTSSFRELASMAPAGTLITVASLLALAGAFTKSAQFPFHFWLPGAMSAPTPVSAYLHSATMVKAGIVLIARLAPIVGHNNLWRWTIVLVGGTTMVFGGVRAIRAIDAKLLLAHSTVSQLGFLTILMGLGVPGATYAGVAHLLAHAVFKAGLFLSVGIVDHATGSRDIRLLSGVGRSMPIVAFLTGISAASMAGLIPFFGFVTKEKALVALLSADENIGFVANVALSFVVVGSVLSVVYSIRLLHGLFSSKPGVQPSVIDHPPSTWGLVAPMSATVVVTVLAGLTASTIGRWLDSPAQSLDPKAYGQLTLWPGINTALLLSAGIVVAGAFISRFIPLVPWRNPITISGENIFQRLYDGLLQNSKRITRVTQSGSLLVYNSVIVLVVISVLAVTVLSDTQTDFGDIVFADSSFQFVVVLFACLFTLGVAFTQQRFVAAVLLGGLGFACALIFVMFGAPDLALTQILVETLVLVVFLLVLRQIPQPLEHRAEIIPRTVRIVIACSLGILVSLFTIMVSDARTAPTVGNEYTLRSVEEAGGQNVVNVILVDFRATDTLGEITVLALAAVGVVQLVRMAHRRRQPLSPDNGDTKTSAGANQ